MAHGAVVSAIGRQWLRLHLAGGVGPITCARLLEAFGTPEAVFEASSAQLQQVEGVGPKTARAICQSRDDGRVDRELALAEAAGVRILCRDDEDYPVGLRHIPDPPTCLYVKGTLQPDDAVAVAIVGTRRASHYGAEQARRFGYLLAQAGFTVVSGLARGIDSWAHIGALEAGGRTLAVLGNGLAHLYPPENAELAGRIIEAGALLSELPMETAPDAQNFPPRNRIIAGLTLGVIVVEGSRRSGAMITARLASEYNREVFAVPGRIDAVGSQGPNGLIRDHAAKLITCLEDVLDELGDVARALPSRSDPHPGRADDAGPRLDETERRIVGAIGEQERSISQICDATGLAASRVAASLTMLQLKGVVKQLAGGLFVRTGRSD